MIKKVYSSSCKLLVILVLFARKVSSLHSFSKNTQISNVMKIRPMCSMGTDGRTDRHDKANSRFSKL